MNNNVAVVIPYYHENLTELEKISYVQCIKILSDYPIILLVPDKMRDTEYPHGKGILSVKIPSRWFESVDSYNKMMLDLEFYQHFEKYEYLLIYQLDAFVFEDRLEEFCNYGFDYIGAPWLGGARYYRDLSRYIYYVGNGGLSLRKVKTFIQILSKVDMTKIDCPEDLFWSSCQSECFRVAPVDIALQFSFEQHVQKCWDLNKKRLPFGCHAWQKYNFSFWKPFFTSAGYYINEDLVEDKDITEEFWDLADLEVEDAVLLDSCEKYLHLEKKPIYIWGSGIWGKECGWLLKKCGMNEFRYIDVNIERQKEMLWGVSINPPDLMLKTREKNATIIIAVKGKEQEILDILENVGYRYQKEVFFYKEWVDKLIKDS